LRRTRVEEAIHHRLQLLDAALIGRDLRNIGRTTALLEGYLRAQRAALTY
jgi:hypothetical protein